MRTPESAAARELEALVLRAVRRGVLEVAELTDAYRALAPASHRWLDEPRRLDLHALLQALAQLPPGTLIAARVLVVARAAGHGLELQHAPIGRYAWLDDGTLVLEARSGLASLLSLAAHLACVTIEWDKAVTLLAANGSPHEPTLAAFALGTTAEALLEADTLLDGAMSHLLANVPALPRIELHAELTARALEERATQHATAVVTSLAELGLAGRPLHLWVGPRIITDCLSPYTRELAGALVAWAHNSPGSLGSDLIASGELGTQDALYAIAHDFWRHDPSLWSERVEADRTVGIVHREHDGVAFELIDLARIDPTLCDARMMSFDPMPELGTLVRVSCDPEDTAGTFLATLLQMVGPTVASITLTLEGTALTARAGAVIHPTHVVDWLDERAVVLPRQSVLDPRDLLGFVDTEPQTGAVLRVPAPVLLSATQLDALGRQHKLAAVDTLSATVVGAVVDALVSRVLRDQTRVAYALAATEAVSTGRPSVTSLRALSAIALDTLRRLAAAVMPRVHEPPPLERTAHRSAPPAAPPPRRGPSSRAVRIKA